MPAVLTIAGSDSGGGAGIQADLKTITALGLYGTSVITAITAQNTLGVQAVSPASPEILAAQLDSVLSDLTPQAIKIGMLGNKTAVQVVAEKLSAYPDIPVVLDPVLISTSGRPLAAPDAIAASQELLFPRATLLTPNLPEAEFLLQMQTHTLDNDAGIEAAATRLSRQFHTAVLLKGGHRENLPNTVCDVSLSARSDSTLVFQSPDRESKQPWNWYCTSHPQSPAVSPPDVLWSRVFVMRVPI
ncbi:MAG: bifunctional hydroxymethylpyrimidine kinase/phosphomethylpyrimidine kinase [Clostridium fessum]